jgi:hypothetical protein
VHIFKTKEFGRFARREGLSDDQLCEAIERAGRGLVDADLGGSVIKQRVARKGQGRSGGFRTIIAFRWGSRSIFIHGFAKNVRDNISAQELADLKDLAAAFLSWSDDDIKRLTETGAWIEVSCDDEKLSQ